MSERFKCDRRGGQNRAPYMRRRAWWCSNCGARKNFAGHNCQNCRRRVCCSCFHHGDGVCLNECQAAAA